MLAYLSGRGVAVREMHAAGRPCWRHFLGEGGEGAARPHTRLLACPLAQRRH